MQVIGIFVGMVLFFLICMLLRQTLFSLHAGIAAVLAVVLYLIYKSHRPDGELKSGLPLPRPS